MKKLAILGASGHGKVIADAALAAGWKEICFFDDAWPGKTANGRWEIKGGTRELLAAHKAFDGVIVGIGDGRVRWEKQQTLELAAATIVSIVHPKACLSPFATIGAGSVVFAGAIINIDTTLGKACIVNTGATIDHDCKIADSVHIAPGANISGNVSISPRSWIGVGATVRQELNIGADVMVGAGAVVLEDIGNGLTVVGNPAKKLERA